MGLRPEHWTDTGKTRDWILKEKATRLASYGGWDFWEHPIYGDEAPILATKLGAKKADWVWNTQDFDLPNKDDL